MKTAKHGPSARRASGEPAPKVRPDRSGLLHVELISVGRELLRGRIVDGNSQFLAGFFSARGALIRRIVVVDDNDRAITGALLEALERNPNLVVVSGGLGVAADDRTLAAVAAALGRPLTVSQPARDMVEHGYRRLYEQRAVRTAGMTEAREKLCRIPVGSDVVPNALGLSPGVICNLPGGASVLCLPGSPDEMRAVLEAALPMLKDKVPRQYMSRREIEAPIPDESALRPMLDQLSREFSNVAVSSRPVSTRRKGLKVVVSLESTAATEEQADAAIDEALRRLLAMAAGSR